MDDLIFYEYAIAGRYSDLCLYYESHPELLEKGDNQELLEAAKFRKLFYECDRVISTLAAESDLNVVNDLLNTLKEKWNITSIPEDRIKCFWDDYETLITMICLLNNTDEKEVKSLIQKFWPDKEQYDKVSKLYAQYKLEDYPEQDMMDVIRNKKMSMSKLICEIEANSCGTPILENYVNELEKGINESDIPYLNAVLEDLKNRHKKEQKAKEMEEKRKKKMNTAMKLRNQMVEDTKTLLSFASSDEDCYESSSSSMEDIIPVIVKPFRIRREWTAEEVKGLKKGLKKYGESKWKQIQIDFLPNRTNVMIKDKVRSMKNSKNENDRRQIWKWINYYIKKHPEKYRVC